MSSADPLVSVDWLKARMGAPDLRIVEATWFVPFAAPETSARDQYEAGHIPGAVFFDIDHICDPDGQYPHTFPPSHVFSSRVRKLGLGDGHRILVYDRNGFFAAARVWWMFRAMGVEDIKVLDGGYNAWLNADGEVEDLPPIPVERHFTPRVRGDLVKTKEQVRQAAEDARIKIIDARPAGRFTGAEAEPRPGLPSGHIPGSVSIPGGQLLGADGKMKSADELKALFEASDIDPAKPVITSCGSGVTAAITALALARLGNMDVSVYDGSWTEWASTDGYPIATSN